MSILGAFIVPHPPLIVPAVGRGEEKKIQNTTDAYEQFGQAVAALRPEIILVISPHSVMYADYIHISPGKRARGDFSRFGAGGNSIEKVYDTEFIESLSAAAEKEHIPAGTLGEREKALDHGVMVPLNFIEKYYKEYKLVRVSISGLSSLTHYRFGQCIARAADALGRKTVIVASGDLSHKLKADGPYGFAEEGPEFDRQVTEAMASGDFLRFLSFSEDFTEAAAECGLRSFIEMAGALDRMAVKTNFLSYEGPFGVGYAVCLYHVSGPEPGRDFGSIYEKEQREKLALIARNEDDYVRLARLSLEYYVKNHRRVKRPDGLPEDMLRRKAGVFVSLKKDGRLRGCIGTISPAQPCIADEIICNAVSAGAEDPRFNPVEEEELPSLVYSVDVLEKPEPISSTAELDAKRYGVIVSSGVKRGLLLPSLEGVDTPEQQISIALQKAGIPSGEKYTMERFEVTRHK